MSHEGNIVLERHRAGAGDKTMVEDQKKSC